MRSARRAFPFVFGGDGASFAVGPQHAPAAARGAARRWRPSAHAEFGMDLRVAMIAVADIRAGGRDVRVARFGASRALRPMRCSPAAGLPGSRSAPSAATTRCRSAPPDARPDLSGLSCRWAVSPAERGGRSVADRRAARRRSPLRGPARRGRRDGDEGRGGGRPVTVEGSAPADPGRRSPSRPRPIKASGVSALKARLKAAGSYAVG